MSEFGGVDFSVKLQDGRSPQPQRGNDGIRTLKLDIVLRGEDTYEDFIALQSRGTAKVPNGTNATNWHSNNGVGSRTLVVPWYRGHSKSYTAVLTSLSLEGSLAFPNESNPMWVGSAEFVILTVV